MPQGLSSDEDARGTGIPRIPCCRCRTDGSSAVTVPAGDWPQAVPHLSRTCQLLPARLAAPFEVVRSDRLGVVLAGLT
jgi:hypothetical protein